MILAVFPSSKLLYRFALFFQVEETEADADDPAPEDLPKKKLTLTFNEYQNLTNSLVIYMRNLEEKRVAEGNLHFSLIIGLNITPIHYLSHCRCVRVRYLPEEIKRACQFF